MKDNGFVFLHRKFKEWEWYKNINVKTLFIHCLIMANFKDNQWQGIEIKRGSFITSISNLANETGLSDRQVRTALNKLILTSELTNKSTNKYRLITVLKYNQYQTLDKQLDNQMTIKRQTNDKQMTTTNKDNNLKKENNDNKQKLNTPLEIAIDDFVKFRKTIKKPMTSKALILFKNKLNDLANDDSVKIKIIEQSILNGWATVYELKKDNSYGKNNKPTKPGELTEQQIKERYGEA
jgi:hypothetical protein